MDNSKGMAVFTIVTTIVGLILGVIEVTSGGAVSEAVSSLIFPSNTRFSCISQPDTKRGGEVWTVMYRNHNGK